MQQPQAAGVGPAHRDQVPPPGPFSPPLPTPGTPPGLRTDRPSAPPPAVSLVCPTGPVSPPGGHPGASGDGLGWGALLASRAAEHPGRPAAGAARALELRARAEGTSAGVYPCHCWPVTGGRLSAWGCPDLSQRRPLFPSQAPAARPVRSAIWKARTLRGCPWPCGGEGAWGALREVGGLPEVRQGCGWRSERAARLFLSRWDWRLWAVGPVHFIHRGWAPST